ncbi:MAG: hypothetical protein FWD90_10075 [Defluviitaleaceae bacterium]|nr:hypothetical protein [Defluviitaleaceae bacterium]
MTRFALGKGLFLLAFVFVILVASDFGNPRYLPNLLDIPTFVWFLLVLAGVIIITGEFKTFVAAMNALLSKKYVISAHTQEKAVRLFKLMGKSIVYAIVVNVAIMMSMILIRVDDFDFLGPMISVVLLSVAYGGLFNLMLVNPAVSLLESRHNAQVKTVISERQVIDKLLELCYRQGITPEEIINAAEISFKEEK